MTLLSDRIIQPDSHRMSLSGADNSADVEILFLVRQNVNAAGATPAHFSYLAVDQERAGIHLSRLRQSLEKVQNSESEQQSYSPTKPAFLVPLVSSSLFLLSTIPNNRLLWNSKDSKLSGMTSSR